MPLPCLTRSQSRTQLQAFNSHNSDGRQGRDRPPLRRPGGWGSLLSTSSQFSYQLTLRCLHTPTLTRWGPPIPNHCTCARELHSNSSAINSFGPQTATSLTDGKSAIELLCGGPGVGQFDILLLDICMPEVDGLAVAKAIRYVFLQSDVAF